MRSDRIAARGLPGTRGVMPGPAAMELPRATYLSVISGLPRREQPVALVASLELDVERLDLEVPLLIENTAGGENAMARHLERIEQLWAAVTSAPNADWVGFCLDTCHAHAGGE